MILSIKHLKYPPPHGGREEGVSQALCKNAIDISTILK